MKADWNLMRQIALAVENSSTAGLPEIVGRSEEEVGYHAHLLIGSGLAEGFSVRNMGHRLPFDFISDLTVAGHEFAELARNDDRWHAAMTQAQGSGAVTLATLQNLLTHPPRQQAVPPNGKSGQETIQIIANKALTFLKDGYGGEQVTVKPGGRPQPVPGWVRESATFKHAATDGSVMEVEIKTPRPPPTASKSTPVAPGAFGQPGFGQQGVLSDPAALSPGREYPRWIYHATEKPKMVSSRQEEVALGPEWSRVYIHQEYPKVKYHWSGKEITVQTADEEVVLGGGWANTPAAFAPYKGPRTAGAEHHPERWVDEWPISGLSSEDRKRIKAQLWRADSEFWKSPDAPSADTAAMRLAFDGVGNVLFSAGILTEQLLRDQIPLLVWDSAIAAGWWRLASETPQDMFREQLGHYWVWREEGKDWQGLFRSETGKWRAQLLECASESPKSAPANGPPDVDAVMDTFRTIAGMKASDSENRGFWLTVEIFPSLASFVPEKLGWAVEEIVDEHEVTIRKAVIEALSGLRSSNSDQEPSTLIFDAVVEMGTELFNEALGRMDWMDDNNPPEAYDDAADALYQDAIDFVVRKYKTLAAEIPGLSPACEAARLDTLRVEWLQIREEAKQQTHEWARKIRESQAEADRLRAGNAAMPDSEEAPAKKLGDEPSGDPKPVGAPSGGINRRNVKETPPGSMDRVEMTDPIWDFSGTKSGPISIKRLSGEVDMIDPSTEDEPDDADLNQEEERGISEGTIGGRSELRTEIEAAFSGSDWPPPNAIIQAFRRHALKVFDVNAAAYRRVISEQGRDAKMALSAMSRNLLVGLFGREWENSPGERVVRIRWQDGVGGWKGEEISVIAGNDPDPTCLYHQLVGEGIKYRYRFHAPLPPHVPGEPPGLGVSNLEWWEYIGLKERHNLAMAIKPYLEDRVEHWLVVYTPTTPVKSAGNSGTGKIEVPNQPPRTVQPSPTDAISMESPIRIKFEAGLALGEVTLDQDLKAHGPSLEIAQKYVTAATLTLAKCILTPNCPNPYEAIERTYKFAEWFAGEAIKPAWVWLCVFSEMHSSGKLEKYKRDRVAEDGKAERMSESEIRAWHACLFDVAHGALDDFVPGFWKDRLKYFSESSREGSGAEPVESTPTDETGDHVGSVLSEGQEASPVQSRTRAGTPADRLSEFMKAHPTATYADVRFTADVYKADFQNWRKDGMKAESVMAQRIEKVVGGETPLRKKPANRRPD